MNAENSTKSKKQNAISDLKRVYTNKLENQKNLTEIKDVYDLFEWKRVDVILKDYSTGRVITDMPDLEFPSNYSQNSCDIIASKYFRKRGVNCDGRAGEYSMRQVVHRMTKFWVGSLLDEGAVNEEEGKILYDELAFLMLSQAWAPNSPQFFNTGLLNSYNINGPSQGHYYYDIKSNRVVKSKDAYTRTQGSACFIIGVEDKLIGNKSLTDQLTTETLLFKYGSGVGTNWSSVRANEEHLSAGGKSSGLLSFLKVSDTNAGAIKSGGTTRRAAKMNILDLDHPEIMQYIEWKSKEEDKVKALGKMGYNTTIDGDAYDTVSGQNANNSIRIPDAFMNLLDEPGAMWETTGRVDNSVDKLIPVKELWDRTSKASWRCGDPGIQFDDTINAWNTCPAGEDGKYNAKHNRINASNPCSEYMFLDDTACNLASINVLFFYDSETGKFDIEGYMHAVQIIQYVLEGTIHHGQFPTADIARRSHMFRTTGLGLTNIGALFMCLGIPYDSKEARTLGAALCSIMTGHSYYTSSILAKNVGAFAKYSKNKKYMLNVIKNHAYVAGVEEEGYVKNNNNLTYELVKIDHEVLKSIGLGNLSDALLKVWFKTIEHGTEHGFRNAQVTVLAPTGTIAFAMDCSTTSSEPFFSHVAYKKLVGGNHMKIINPTLPIALKKMGYTNIQIDDIVSYVMEEDEDGNIIDGKIEGAPHLKIEHYSIFDTANRCGTGERYITPEGHVNMMAALTPNVTGAISKTVNLPNSATVEDISSINRLAWKLGVKSIALFRDNCKESQPLNSAKFGKKEIALEDLSYQELLEYSKKQSLKKSMTRVKPSGIRNAHIHEASIGGLKLYITTSFYDDGRIGELYISSGRQGSLTKGLLDSISTTLSEFLQYGVPPQEIAHMYRGQKFEPSGIVAGHPHIKMCDSISDLISKIIDIELGDYSSCQVKPIGWKKETLKDETKESKIPLDLTKISAADYIHGEVCSNCKGNKLVKNGTCKVCADCGTTTGCS